MPLVRLPFCLLLMSAAAPAQRSPLPPDRLAKVRGVLDAVYRLDYEESEKLSREMISRWPDDPVGYVYLARVYWQELLLDERALNLQRFSQPGFFSETPQYKASMNPASAQRFQVASREAILRAKAFAAKRPRDAAALFLLGTAYQNEASFQISLNNAWLAAARAGHLSYVAHRDLLALDSQFGDSYLVTGIYNYTLGSLPWNVRWIAVLLGYRGSAEKGKQELEAAASRGAIVADDARTLLTLVYFLEKRYDLAIQKLDELCRKYPENYLTRLDLAGVRLRRGDSTAAIGIYREILAEIDKNHNGFARLERSIVLNELAVAYRTLKDYSQAEQWFRLSLDSSASSTRSRVTALLELGKTFDLAGRRDDAVRQYRLVQQAQEFANSHREATLYLTRPYRDR